MAGTWTLSRIESSHILSTSLLSAPLDSHRTQQRQDTVLVPSACGDPSDSLLLAPSAADLLSPE